MYNILKEVVNNGEWKPLRFTVYNHLDEKESYIQNLKRIGYNVCYDDLEGKVFEYDNVVARGFKSFIENKLQGGNVIVAVCVIDDWKQFTIVKPKNVDLFSVLKIE